MRHHGEDQHEAYSMPQAAPLYPEPPYEYPAFTALLLQCQFPAETVRGLVPAPLEPVAGAPGLLAVYDYEGTDGLGAYREFLVGLPVTYGGERFTYAPLMVLGSDAAIAAGREIWGIPKEAGEVDLDPGGAMPTARVERGGATLLTASLDPTDSTDDHPLRAPEFRSVQWKRIPAAERGAPPVVNRLVVSRTHEVETDRALTGPAAVDMGGSAADPLEALAPTGEVTGYLVSGSWLLDTAEDAVLHRFEEAE
jgi:acetoacetate decarboxylase